MPVAKIFGGDKERKILTLFQIFLARSVKIAGAAIGCMH